MIDIDHMCVMESNKPRLRQLIMQFSYATAYRQLRAVHTMDTCIAAVGFQTQDLGWLQYGFACRNRHAGALYTSNSSGGFAAQLIAPISAGLTWVLWIIAVDHGQITIKANSYTGPPKRTGLV